MFDCSQWYFYRKTLQSVIKHKEKYMTKLTKIYVKEKGTTNVGSVRIPDNSIGEISRQPVRYV